MGFRPYTCRAGIRSRRLTIATAFDTRIARGRWSMNRNGMLGGSVDATTNAQMAHAAARSLGNTTLGRSVAANVLIRVKIASTSASVATQRTSSGKLERKMCRASVGGAVRMTSTRLKRLARAAAVVRTNITPSTTPHARLQPRAAMSTLPIFSPPRDMVPPTWGGGTVIGATAALRTNQQDRRVQKNNLR